MHVLILPSWYFPAGSAEISGRMFHQLARALKSEGIDARILYAELNLRSPLLKKMRFEEEDQVPTWRINQWSPPKLTSFLIRNWIKKYVHELLLYIQKEGRPDLIHAQSYMAGMVCATLKRKTGI